MCERGYVFWCTACCAGLGKIGWEDHLYATAGCSRGPIGPSRYRYSFVCLALAGSDRVATQSERDLCACCRISSRICSTATIDDDATNSTPDSGFTVRTYCCCQARRVVAGAVQTNKNITARDPLLGSWATCCSPPQTAHKYVRPHTST